jgi:hypothetical protein
MEPLYQKGFSSLIDWGPGMVIAALMLYGLYRLIKGTGLKIVAALEKPAEALTQQAQSMDRLTHSIQDYVYRDSNEHLEIIILQKVIRDEIKEIRNQSERIEQRIGEINGGPPIRNA